MSSANLGFMSQLSIRELRQYRRCKVIGKGAFGKVYEGQHPLTGEIVALKIIDLDKGDEEDVVSIQKEVMVLSQLSNAPNITKYYGCYLDGPEVCIVMEYAHGGSVYDIMQSLPNHCLDEKSAAVIIREMLLALSFLHKVPVIHRDIKCANILLTHTGKVLLCDFGVSALLQGSSNRRYTWIGSPYWMAPEIISGVGSYDVKVDIWSLGIALYEMIKGAPPLAHLAPQDVLDRIPHLTSPRFSESDASPHLRDFLASCLKERPDERFPAAALQKAKWMNSVNKVHVSVLKNIITIKPARESLADDGQDSDNESERPESWAFTSPEHADFSMDTIHSTNTIRAAPRALPTSLRGLFLVEEEVPFDPQAYLNSHAMPPTPASLSSFATEAQTRVQPPPLMPTPIATQTRTPLEQSSYMDFNEEYTPQIQARIPDLPDILPLAPLSRKRSQSETVCMPDRAADGFATLTAKDTQIDNSQTMRAQSVPYLRHPRSLASTSTSMAPAPSQKGMTSAGAFAPPPLRAALSTILDRETEQGHTQFQSPLSLHSSPRLTERRRKGHQFNKSATEQKTPNFKDFIKVPSITEAQQLAIPDLLPPSPAVALDRHPHAPPERSESLLSLPPEAPHMAEANGSAQLLDFNIEPFIRPLDYASLMDPETFNSEFERTMENLDKLLGIMNHGFNSLLEDDKPISTQ